MPDTIKETNFFGRDHWVDESRRITNESQYLDLFAHKPDAKRIGEKAPLLFYSSTAAKEIEAYNPHSDIIIALRNPVDMLYSWHRQCLTNYNETILDFAEALAAEKDRARGLRIPSTATYPDGLQYVKVASYYTNVKRYYDVFDQNHVHVIIYDDVVRDLPGVYRNLLEFLGVDSGFQPESFARWNEKVPLRSLRVRRFFHRWPKLESAVRKTIPKPMFRGIAKSIAALATPERPPLSPELRARLQHELSPDIEKISELLDRDLTHWCRD